MSPTAAMNVAAQTTFTPAAFSQKAPVPGDPTVGSELDSNLSTMIFMPRA
jgi:hypothetical protein